MRTIGMGGIRSPGARGVEKTMTRMEWSSQRRWASWSSSSRLTCALAGYAASTASRRLRPATGAGCSWMRARRRLSAQAAKAASVFQKATLSSALPPLAGGHASQGTSLSHSCMAGARGAGGRAAHRDRGRTQGVSARPPHVGSARPRDLPQWARNTQGRSAGRPTARRAASCFCHGATPQVAVRRQSGRTKAPAPSVRLLGPRAAGPHPQQPRPRLAGAPGA